MKEWVKKLIIVLSILAVIVVIAVLLSMRKVENFSAKYEGTDLTKDVAGMERFGTYNGYLNDHKDASLVKKSVDVDIFDYTSEGDVSVQNNYEGESKVLLTELDSTVTFKVDIPETGFYNMEVEYLLPESRGVPAERAVYINGELPFNDAKNITFSRIWTNGGDVRVDNQGNEIRPAQVEVYDWQKSYFKDKLGFITEPFVFYMEKGPNEISLKAENEPMAIRKLTVTGEPYTIPYEEYIKKAPSVNASESALNYVQIVQGEDSTVRSESSLYAKYDRSSPSTQPASVTHTVLNYVGGQTWRSTGQWIEWDVEAPEDGFYNITVKGRQNYSRGTMSTRTLYIDGEIPFEEVKTIAFPYTNDWECKTLSDAEGNPYSFYLTKGTHHVRLQASLGGAGAILEDLQDSTYRLNQIYRKVLVYTGANPDIYRDYHIDTAYPEIMSAMDLEAKRLYKIVDDMVLYAGQKAPNIAAAQTVAQQLERFCNKPNKITLEFVIDIKIDLTHVKGSRTQSSDVIFKRYKFQSDLIWFVAETLKLLGNRLSCCDIRGFLARI